VVTRVVCIYIAVLGSALLIDGAGLIVLDQLHLALPFSTSDLRHNLLHVVWGIALLAVTMKSGPGRQRRLISAALIFGAFYTALGVVGLTVDRPFGLLLGPGENAFHFTVGPLSLIIGAWALRSVDVSRPTSVGSMPAARRANEARLRHR
jgi:hypothetical protein